MGMGKNGVPPAYQDIILYTAVITLSSEPYTHTQKLKASNIIGQSVHWELLVSSVYGNSIWLWRVHLSTEHNATDHCLILTLSFSVGPQIGFVCYFTEFQVPESFARDGTLHRGLYSNGLHVSVCKFQWGFSAVVYSLCIRSSSGQPLTAWFNLVSYLYLTEIVHQ